MKILKLPLALSIALMCGSHLIWAQVPPDAQAGPENISGQQGGEPHHRPPPEAYAACEGKAAGVAASFANQRGETINGICQADRSGNLVVRPAHPQDGDGGRHRGPPPEAYTACAGKTAGSKSQFVSPRGHTIAGTCETDNNNALVLRPDHPPRDDQRGQGGDAPN